MSPTIHSCAGNRAAAHRDQGGRAVHAGHPIAALDEVAGDRLAHAAADVEDRPPGRYPREEAVEPRLFVQVAAALLVPGRGILLVKADDPLGRLSLERPRGLEP